MMVLDSGWELSEIAGWKGFTLEWMSEDECFLSRGNRLFRVARKCGQWLDTQPSYSVPAPIWKAIAGRSRLAARLMRFSFYNLLRIGLDDWFYTFDRSIGRLRDGKTVPVTDQIRPMRVLRGGCCVTEAGNILFGEYIGNPRRDYTVRIFRYCPSSDRVEVAHAFEAGQIRHIHGIYADTIEPEVCWALCGDLPYECRIYRSRDEFRSIEPVGMGDETWRAVSVRFAKKGLIYGMDAEFAQNHLFCLDRESGIRTKLADLGGPVYYSCSSGSDHFFGVTAELCPSQREPHAELWRVGIDLNANCLVIAQKDRWPVRYFQAGHFQFPQGPGLNGQLYFSALGLADCDGGVYRLQHRSAPHLVG